MAHGLDEDEFDALPDAFQDVDWDSIPAMSQQPLPHGASTSSQTPPLNTSQGTVVTSTVNTPVSDDYDLDELDESFLGEIDAIERNLTQTATSSGAAGGPSTRTFAPVPSHAVLHSLPTTVRGALSIPPRPSTENSREKRSKESSEPSSPQKRVRRHDSQVETPARSPSRKSKGKRREREVHEGVKKVLEGFEDDLSCPICCDIFACAHLGNPCGHSFCGECGYDWIQKNKRMPTCAICRATLSAGAPMIPNFAMDNTIERHIQALAASNVDEWKETGDKFKEWLERKEKWKAGAVHRAEAKAATIDLNRSVIEESSADSNESSSSQESSSSEEAEPLLPRSAAPVLPFVASQSRSGGDGGGRGGRGRWRGGRRRNRNGNNGNGGASTTGGQHRRGRGRGRA